MRHQSEAVLGFHSSVDIVVESGREGQAEMLEQSHSEQEDDGPAEIVSDAHAAPALERHETVRLLQSPLGRASSAPVRHVDKEALRTELQRIRPQGRIEIHCPPDGHDHGPFRDPITSQMAILKHHKRKYNLNRDKVERELFTSNVPCGTPSGNMVLIRWTSHIVASVQGIRLASVA